MSSSKLSLFLKEVHLYSGVRLLLELYCVVVIKHVVFFTIWVKLAVTFSCTSLPLNLNTSVFGCGCGFGFETNFGGSMNLAKKGTDRRICIPLFTPLNTDTSPTQMLHSVPSIWCPFLRGWTVLLFFHLINPLLTKGCLVMMAIALDIFTFMDLNSISAHKHTKTNLGPISSHLDHMLGH